MSKIHSVILSDLTGYLLIASPQLMGTFFAQSVIYIYDYSKKDGATGVIINKRLSNFKIENVFKKHDTPFLSAMPRRFIGLGGPVNIKKILIVHTPLPDESPEIQGLRPARLSEDLDILQDMTIQQGPEHAFIVIGQAKWVPGQLETELLLNHYWFLAPATKKLVFETDYHKIWEEALASIGMKPAFLSCEKGES